MNMLGFMWMIRELILPLFELEELALLLPSVSVVWMLELATMNPFVKQLEEIMSTGLDLALVTLVSC